MQLDTNHRRLIELANEVSKNFAARTALHDEKATFPAENFRDLHEAGLLTLTVPKDHGGHGLWTGKNYAPYYSVLETVATNCSATAQMLQVHSHAVGMIAALGSNIERYMAPVVEEGALFASVGSEASIRNDKPEGFDTVLTRTANGSYSLSGFKGFATLAPVAHTLLVWTMQSGARSTRDGITFVAIPRDREGITLIDNWDTMGMRPTVSWALKLENVEVKPEEIIGKPGDWVTKDPRTFTLGYASNHTGQATAVYNFVVDYATKYGGLDKNPVVQIFLAEADCKVNAARALVHEAAAMWEAGDFDAAELQSMRAMHLAKEAANWLSQHAFDICGARSTHKSYPLERLYRDIRTFTLHFRSETNLFMLANAALGKPFHSKTRYDRVLASQ